ncbi:apoptosis inducing factor mitochondria associated 4 isoform X3 [Ictalurus furcatus]|uniref:apoptosis inducing factor mitochondria associated 4 isoform X3 n=1 Tax=Ictalurus furcatus TaxID=66913 RepID=UPI0023509863|nr:apoptosis inducing factor mitochondria associated 4 isoform X3 [Ictalurus furcatus]
MKLPRWCVWSQSCRMDSNIFTPLMIITHYFPPLKPRIVTYTHSVYVMLCAIVSFVTVAYYRMKEVEVDHQKMLLVHNEGQFSAVGALCTHYGAPLIKGVLMGNRVRCPWHGACFNTKTGDIEEFPGLDSLPTYKVKVENGKVHVTRNKKTLTKRVKEMSCRVPGVCHAILLIGGGPASLQCAETLRQNDYQGRIIMVTKDEKLPLDKTKLSKAMNIESEKILLRSSDFLKQHGIEVWTEKEVVSIDTEEHTVSFHNGTTQHYNQLLIATGARARRMQCPGSEMENVKLLQCYKDAAEIYQMSVGNRVVIVGTSFIGMEAAAFLSDKATSVAVVGKSDVPYQFSLGPDIGKMTMQMLEEKYVRFYMNNGVAEIQGENGKVRTHRSENHCASAQKFFFLFFFVMTHLFFQVKQVILQNGEVLPADVVIVGIGVIPNSDFLKGSMVEVDSRNAITVDKFMRTNNPDVFAAGDVASFPLSIQADKRVNIGHWQLAQAHGRVAALNMLKKQTKLHSVPYFWTVLLGKSIRYTGYGEGYTDIVFKGSVDERKFLAFYIKGDEVIAAASLNFDPAVSRVAEIMATGKNITKLEAESEDLGWLQLT